MFEELKKELDLHGTVLVAVSKTHPIERIQPLYTAGQRVFGENKVQELVEKYQQMPKDIQWHLIGSLQKNKVKYIAPFISMIHSVDRLDLLKEINRQALACGRVIDCLLQFHIAQEDTKFGLDFEEAKTILQSPDYLSLQNVRLCGVMGMASFTDNTAQVRTEFHGLKRIFEQLKEDYFADKPYFEHISMGMSGDWRIAVKEGSTMVRIGSLLFGAR